MKVTYIEGAMVKELKLKRFSRECILEHAAVTDDELIAASGDEDSALGIDVNRINDLIVVTVFNDEGEAYFYIGHWKDYKIGADFLRSVDLSK